MEQEKSYFSNQVIIHLEVPLQSEPLRLDSFLKEKFSHRSREQLKKVISSGVVSVKRNQAVGKLKPSFQLLAGDKIQVISKRNAEPEVNFDYKVIYEDEALLVINKPGNLPVHPAGSYYFHTLLIHLRTKGFTQEPKETQQYYLPHRIDKETSGIIVLCKTPEHCANLTHQFASRVPKKRYLAICYGKFNETSFNVNSPMKRAVNSKIRLKMQITNHDDNDALSAQTDFKVLSAGNHFSLVECFPKTGRQHQIRVHLESIGHPIVGDKLYSLPESEAVLFYEIPQEKYQLKDKDNPYVLAPRMVKPQIHKKLILQRQALHASEIEFKHPISGETVKFKADLADDLKKHLQKAEGLSNDHLLDSQTPLDTLKTYSLEPL